MTLGYAIKTYISNHKTIGCPSLWSATTSQRINTPRKKVETILENRVRCQRFHSYFHHMIFTINFYYFDSKNRYAISVIFPNTGDNQWTKCHSLLWLALMKLGIQKAAMDLYVFPRQVLVLKKGFIPLNSSSISMEYNQILQ